jgi:predicted DNA-binding ribbon-helix-helix protein
MILVVKRSIVIDGHKTSVSLEEPFWLELKDIAEGRNVTLSSLVAAIDADRHKGNLSSAIRLFVLENVRNPVRGSHWLVDGRGKKIGERIALKKPISQLQ